MTPEEGISKLQEKTKAILFRLPMIIGNEAVNFTLDNFRRQGFLGSTFERWNKRKKSWRKKDDNGRSILISTGRLRRSVRVIQATPDTIVIGSDVPYAKAHNEGLRLGVIQSVQGFTRKNGVDVKAHKRRINMKIPRRRFMGNSPYLNAKLQRVTSAEFNKEIKTL
jgi:phage gpG-like protein